MREYGSEHPAIVIPDGYFNSLSELGREVLFLRSGREALMLSAITISESEEKDKTILFPAYCCWSMSAPFEKIGWNIIYYRINEDLTVDIEYIKQLMAIYKPHAVLLMNYYGSAPTDETASVLKNINPDIKLVEDFSHCTFSIKQIHNPFIDIYVSSIRKSIGVCDGAVILSNIPLKRSYIENELPDFADTRFAAQCEKKRYQWNNDAVKKDKFLTALRNSEALINEFNSVRPISARAMKMLSLVNGEEIAYARRENMQHLMSLLAGKVKMVPGLEHSLAGAPFSLPILVDNRDEVQRRLAQVGVYAPVLWPICMDAQIICPISKMMSEHILSIPIDQRYDWNDIEVIAERILKVLN